MILGFQNFWTISQMRTFRFFLLFCGALALDLPKNDLLALDLSKDSLLSTNFTCVLTSQARGQSCTTTFNGHFNICQLPDGFTLAAGFPPDAQVLSLYMGTSATYLSGYYAYTFMPTHKIVPPYHRQVLIEASATNPAHNGIYLDPSNPQMWTFSAGIGETCTMPRTQSVCSTPTLTIEVVPDYICPPPYFMSLYATRPSGSHSRACVVDWNPGVSYISAIVFYTDSDWKDVITVDCN